MENKSHVNGWSEFIAPYRRLKREMQRVEQETRYADLVPGAEIPKPVNVSRWSKLIAKIFG